MAEHVTDLLVLLSAAALSFLRIHMQPLSLPVLARAASTWRT